jgi:hypothetical protein
MWIRTSTCYDTRSLSGCTSRLSYCYNLHTRKLDNTTSTFTHVLYLSSPIPFTLVRSSLLATGPNAGHVALLFRQETPFRLMDLPLHIRAKILKYTLKHHEPTISVVIKPSERRPCTPSYKVKNMLAILATNNSMPRPPQSYTPKPSPSPERKSPPTSLYALEPTGVSSPSSAAKLTPRNPHAPLPPVPFISPPPTTVLRAYLIRQGGWKCWCLVSRRFICARIRRLVGLGCCSGGRRSSWGF